MRKRLLKRQRIRKEKSFRTIFRYGRCVRGDFFNLWLCCKQADDESPRTTAVAVMVSKKINPLAVRRNRMRRKIREAFRLGQDRMPEASFVLVQARKSIEKRRPEEILSEIEALLQKAKTKRE
jgi:ribonuclease P protein component